MKTLLDDRLAPLSSSFGLVEAPLEDVANYLMKWRRNLGKAPTRRNLHGDLAKILPSLAPLSTRISPRELLVSAGGWTAYFDCNLAGTDAIGPTGKICRDMQVRGVLVTAIPHTVSGSGFGCGRYGAVSFALINSVVVDDTNIERVVHVSYDTKWVFHSYGAVQDFEEIGQYTAKKIKERFSADMLERYCQALGISVFDPKFYGAEAILVETPDTGQGLRMSLIEAQQHWGVGSAAPKKV